MKCYMCSCTSKEVGTNTVIRFLTFLYFKILFWQVSFFTSLWNHPFFTISCITLIGLFFAGIHKRVVAPSIIAARCRTVLAEYNMSCDDTGKLILKPRPHVQWQSTLIVLGLKTTFLQKVIQQKAIKDSFYSWICDCHSNNRQEMCNISPDYLHDDDSRYQCCGTLIICVSVLVSL